MKNITKVVFGLIAIFSLNACKGRRYVYQDFVDKISTIKEESNIKNAKITYSNTYKSEEGKSSKTYKAEFKKNENGEWERVSFLNTSLDSYAIYFLIDCNLKNMISNESKKSIVPIEEKSEYKIEQYYYFSPFSYEEKQYQEWDYIKSSYYYNFEWNEYGYLTKFKSETKRTHENGGTKRTVSESEMIVKVSYY